MQAGDKFWKVKYDHEAAKKARKEKRAARKEAAQRKGKKATASDLLRLSDSSESEVALDSLGLFFNHLIDTDHQQEDTGTSRSKADEVTILSSDSEPLPRQKIRRVTRKVRFSHPLAHHDPQFLLKRQIHESRRQTRTSKDAELSSGLPNTLRKCRNEVTSILTKFYPLAGLFRQPLNSSDSDYQDTSPSSGESLHSNLPAFKTAPGYDDPLIFHLFSPLHPY